MTPKEIQEKIANKERQLMTNFTGDVGVLDYSMNQIKRDIQNLQAQCGHAVTFATTDGEYCEYCHKKMRRTQYE